MRKFKKYNWPKAIKDTGMTQDQIEDGTGISQSFICLLLNGKRDDILYSRGVVLKAFLDKHKKK